MAEGACALVCCGRGTKRFLSAQKITASFAAISRTLAAPLPGAPALVRQRACRARLLCFAEFGAAGRGVDYPGRGTRFRRGARARNSTNFRQTARPKTFC